MGGCFLWNIIISVETSQRCVTWINHSVFRSCSVAWVVGRIEKSVLVVRRRSTSDLSWHVRNVRWVLIWSVQRRVEFPLWHKPSIWTQALERRSPFKSWAMQCTSETRRQLQQPLLYCFDDSFVAETREVRYVHSDLPKRTGMASLPAVEMISCRRDSSNSSDRRTKREERQKSRRSRPGKPANIVSRTLEKNHVLIFDDNWSSSLEPQPNDGGRM